MSCVGAVRPRALYITGGVVIFFSCGEVRHGVCVLRPQTSQLFRRASLVIASFALGFLWLLLRGSALNECGKFCLVAAEEPTVLSSDRRCRSSRRMRMPFEVHLSLHKLHVVQCSLMLLLSTLLLGEKMGESGSLCTEAFVCVCCGVAKQRSSPSFVELRLRFPVLVVARTVVVFHCCVVLRNCAKFLWISWNIGLFFFLALNFFFCPSSRRGENYVKKHCVEFCILISFLSHYYGTSMRNH